ncbi:MAG: M56 family metallopeptidase [Rhodoglobus sp.]
MIAAEALATLAVALAWPIPLLLSRAHWPRRAPTAALLLWQAIAIAGGLSMIGSLLSFGLAPFGDDLLSAAIRAARLGTSLGMVGPDATGLTVPTPDATGTSATALQLGNALALVGAALLTFHLLLNLLLTVVRSERQRRRHAHLVQLLSSPLDEPAGARLIDSPAPVAYCLPSALSSVTVVSAGLLALLDAAEMRAVIEHEKAHVSQRHDIVLVAFRAWYTSLPWFPIAFRAQREVGLLIEMLADDRARRVVPTATLARAIVLVGAERGAEPVAASIREWGDAASLDELRTRISRLDAPPLPRAAKAAVILAATALLAIPTLLLIAPTLTGTLIR